MDGDLSEMLGQISGGEDDEGGAATAPLDAVSYTHLKQKEDNKGIKVGVSARHVHLSQEHLEILSVRDTNLL